MLRKEAGKETELDIINHTQGRKFQLENISLCLSVPELQKLEKKPQTRAIMGNVDELERVAETDFQGFV